MTDGVKKGNGRSRYMKAALPAGTTWEQALAMLIAGTFPFDMSLNTAPASESTAGWDVQGTMLTKANTISDETAESMGFDTAEEDPTINDALYRVLALASSANRGMSNLDDIEIECNEVDGSGWVDYTFKKPFTDVPHVLAWTGTTLVETTNVTALTMQINAPAKFIAIYDGGLEE